MPQEANEEQNQEQSEEQKATSAPPPAAAFPWLMLCLAIFFDLIGMIPIVNFFSEIIAGLLFGFWQKMYAPKTDPVLSFFIAKIADFIFLGFLPSNIAIVIFAYAKKKIEEKKDRLLRLSKTKLGKYATNKFSQQPA